MVVLTEAEDGRSVGTIIATSERLGGCRQSWLIISVHALGWKAGCRQDAFEGYETVVEPSAPSFQRRVPMSSTPPRLQRQRQRHHPIFTAPRKTANPQVKMWRVCKLYTLSYCFVAIFRVLSDSGSTYQHGKKIKLPNRTYVTLW